MGKVAFFILIVLIGIAGCVGQPEGGEVQVEDTQATGAEPPASAEPTAKNPLSEVPLLAKDFYPNGLTREDLLSRLPEAVQKTGSIEEDETWEGVIRVTGDLGIKEDATVTIKPGTIVFVAARSDDQKTGEGAPKDDFNPKDPVATKEYSQSRIDIVNDGSIIALGTKEQPIIITSDAEDPESDDWLGLNTVAGSRLEFRRVIVEYFRGFGIESSDVTIDQCIMRNMLETVNILGKEEDLLTVRPTITRSHLYNAGHHVLTFRSGAPVVKHNIIRSHPDMEFPGYEQGAIGMDFPVTSIVIENNYLEGNQPVRFDAEVGIMREWTLAEGAVLRGLEEYRFVNNTVVNSENGVGAYPGPWIIENNNIFNNTQNLFLDDSGYAPVGDPWQEDLFERGIIAQPSIVDPFPVKNNYWGTTDEKEIAKKIGGTHIAEVDFTPYKTSFIPEALPNWEEFEWD